MLIELPVMPCMVRAIRSRSVTPSHIYTTLPAPIIATPSSPCGLSQIHPKRPSGRSVRAAPTPSSMPRPFRQKSIKSTSTRQVLDLSVTGLDCRAMMLMFIGEVSDTDRREHPDARVDCLGRVGCLPRAGCTSTTSDELSDGGFVVSALFFFVEVDLSVCSRAYEQCSLKRPKRLRTG
jgi:hypothetical protein